MCVPPAGQVGEEGLSQHPSCQPLPRQRGLLPHDQGEKRLQLGDHQTAIRGENRGHSFSYDVFGLVSLFMVS